MHLAFYMRVRWDDLGRGWKCSACVFGLQGIWTSPRCAHAIFASCSLGFRCAGGFPSCWDRWWCDCHTISLNKVHHRELVFSTHLNCAKNCSWPRVYGCSRAKGSTLHLKSNLLVQSISTSSFPRVLKTGGSRHSVRRAVEAQDALSTRLVEFESLLRQICLFCVLSVSATSDSAHTNDERTTCRSKKKSARSSWARGTWQVPHYEEVGKRWKDGKLAAHQKKKKNSERMQNPHCGPAAQTFNSRAKNCQDLLKECHHSQLHSFVASSPSSHR